MTKTPNIDLANFNFKSYQKEAIDKLKSGQSLTGKDGVLTPLIKQILEAALDGEIENHLTECRQEGAVNRRNGKGKLSKTMKTATGSVDLETPRDRHGSFEPEIVKKRQTLLNESLGNKILSLYVIGMSYQSICEHLQELYGLEVSTAKISQVTDKLLRDGTKDILGLYLSENEGAKFWLGVLNDLKVRGLEDILIASIDGLKGFPEAIAEVYPKIEIQFYVVHQIRNSLKYIVSKDQKAFMKDLKLVYKATSKELAEEYLLTLEDTWGNKYPAVIKFWHTNWEALSQFFKFLSS